MEFAQLWRDQRDILLEMFMDAHSGSLVATQIRNLGLSPSQVIGMRQVLYDALTDTMYTLLLGLDGCACIGDRQEIYKVFSHSGDQLSGDGELEAAAYEVFHNPNGVEPRGVSDDAQ